MGRTVYGFDARVVQDHFPGIGRYAWNLLRHIPDQLRTDEHLIVWRDPAARNTRYDFAQLTHERLRLNAFSVSLFSLKGLLAAPRDVSASVLHFPYYVRPVAIAAHTVTTLHDAIPLAHPSLLPNRRARLMVRVLHWLAVRRSQCVITLSRCAAEELTRYFPALIDKVTVICGAPDPIFAPRDAHTVQVVLQRRGLPDAFALYLASNKPHKNLVRLVDAWRMVVDSLGEARAPLLVIAGHVDPRYPQAQQRAQALDLERSVRFLGPVSDEEAAALYSVCRVFVFPSLHEGFGLTPLEAMACGAPVVCSRASALPEVVGDAALLFDPLDANDIAAACLRALTDDALRAEMRARSLRQAARFRWEDAARQTLEVYREICA